MVKKIGVFIMILGLLFVGVPRFNTDTNESVSLALNTINMAQVNTVDNLASPDLSGVDTVYIGDGDYDIYYDNGIRIRYNVFNGIWTLNGTNNLGINFDMFNINVNTEYTISYIAINGTLSGSRVNFGFHPSYQTVLYQQNGNVNKQTTLTTTSTQNLFRLYSNVGAIFDNFQFKLQLEQGEEATPYKVPMGPLVQHFEFEQYDEGLYSYNAGFDAGEESGYIYGYDDGYYEGLARGRDIGYQEGLTEQDATGFVSLLSVIFGGLGTLLSIELLPGIYIGAIIAVPLVFGIIFFILGKRKGD